jgi:hypothetical protein
VVLDTRHPSSSRCGASQRMAQTGLGHLYTLAQHDHFKRLIMWSCRVAVVVILTLLLRTSNTFRLSNSMIPDQETILQYRVTAAVQSYCRGRKSRRISIHSLRYEATVSRDSKLAR